MTDKERFHAVMAGEPTDRVPYWEQGFWGGAIERWYDEGMPNVYGVSGEPLYGDTVRGPATPIADGDKVCGDVALAAGLDKPTLRVPVELFLSPPFEEKIHGETKDSVMLRDAMGIVKEMARDKGSIPHFMIWPVSNDEDFEQLAVERLDADSADRFPDDWDEQVARLNGYDGVVAIGGHPCGFFGAPRYLMGEIAMMMGFHDNPVLLHRMIDHLADLWATLYDRVMSQVKVDCVHIWEDMSYKNGPLISPAMFEEFLVPAYRKVTDVARSHGVDVILVDTDGDCRTLIPPMLAGGVTGMYPFEVQSGMDVCEIRKTHPTLQILGGIDKMALSGDHDTIDSELQRRILPMMKQGRFIPMADHQVPPQVSWDNYRYYRKRVAEITECGS
ncbi:MAG: uroporphyrinogen decarboxylase family protein [Lentisphaeria bacterium]|jgi:uroporphyrinogen decarboxylase|nr:uroporphyrinogen decarboxylase family protein [Lentisphaeria bacterium]